MVKNYIRFPVISLTSADEIVKDIDSYIETEKPEHGIMIDIDNYVAINKSMQNYLLMRDNFMSQCLTPDGELIHDLPNEESNYKQFAKFLTEYSLDFYKNFIEDIITFLLIGIERENMSVDIATEPIKKHSHKPTPQTAPNAKYLANKRKLYAGIAEIYIKLGLIIPYEEIAHNKVIMEKYTTPSTPGAKISKVQPMGYMWEYNANLYVNGVWMEFNKIQIREPINYKENNHLIGYLEEGPDNIMKFKTRNPLHMIKPSADIRKMERGMVCTTRTKKQLTDMAKSIGINTNTNSFEGKSSAICLIILGKLIELEIKERMKDTSVKYLYLPHEAVPMVR